MLYKTIYHKGPYQARTLRLVQFIVYMCTSLYVCITTAPEVALSSIRWHQAFSSIWWHQAASEVAISSIRWHWAELSAVESEWILLVDSFAKKSKFPFERIFLEPWDPKKWLLDSIYYQNYYV